MYARTTDDYEHMREAGIEIIIEPAFWLGEPRKHPGTFFDYFNHLINFEHSRAQRYGIKQYVAIAMNPKESNNPGLAKAVISELPKYLIHERVVAVGEIGFDRITPQEEESFRAQLELARQHNLLAFIHSPHQNKLKGIQRIISILKELKFDMDKVLIDHNTEETIETSKASGAWCGHTVYPITKLSPQRMANIVQRYGIERMLVNSSADWGPSDPLSIPHTIKELLKRNYPQDSIQKLVWENPFSFFSQSGKMD
jgi:hypothetical protein